MIELRIHKEDFYKIVKSIVSNITYEQFETMISLLQEESLERQLDRMNMERTPF